MVYAPVLIPTLNRYEHLRQCLESLACCTWASETEVYVALDYPPIEQWHRYASGWEKNREYLRSVGNMGFKKLHVIERKENYGIWLPGQKGNLQSLCREVESKYDRYILTEDDNVFSPNFLEFMDKGLEKFENDERVYALSGFRWWFPIKYDTNTFFRQQVECTPWSEGVWVAKRKMLDNIDYAWFRKWLTFGTICNLLKRGEVCLLGSLLEFARSVHKGDCLIDRHLTVILSLTGMQMILPTVSLVKNIGLDGSGVTMLQSDKNTQQMYDNIPISLESHFDFKGTGYEHFAENQTIYRKGKEWQTNSFYRLRLIKKIIRFILQR